MSFTPTTVSAVKTVNKVLGLFLSQRTRELNNALSGCALPEEPCSIRLQSRSHAKRILQLGDTSNTNKRTRFGQVNDVNDVIAGQNLALVANNKSFAPNAVTLHLNSVRIKNHKVHNLTVTVTENARVTVAINKQRSD